MNRIEDTSPAQFAELTTEARVASMQLMQRMVDLLPQDVKEMVAALHQHRGWQLAVEVSCTAEPVGTVSLTMVSPTGERKTLCDAGRVLAGRAAAH